MAIVQSAEALIGNTPLLKLNRLFPGMDIYAKLEYLNPAGSAKDRAARSMLNDLEARGLLQAGGTVVEPTRATPAWRWRPCARREAIS